MVRLAASLLVLAAALAGCSGEKAPQQRTEQDPAVSAALNEQLMTDPDLARINPENRVLAGGGPAAAPIPLEDRSPEAIARGRADAIALLGRAAAPAPAAVGPALPRSATSSWRQTMRCSASRKPGSASRQR